MSKHARHTGCQCGDGRQRLHDRFNPLFKVALAVVVVVAVLGLAGGAVLECRQNQGRTCLAEERMQRHMTLQPGDVRHVDQRDMALRSDFVVPVPRPLFINPALWVVNGSVWMFARYQMEQASWSLCPDNSLYATRGCPVMAPIAHIRMISFIARCRLNTMLEPDTTVTALDYDLD